jgi:hypothetical protein
MKYLFGVYIASLALLAQNNSHRPTDRCASTFFHRNISGLRPRYGSSVTEQLFIFGWHIDAALIAGVCINQALTPSI